MSDAEAFWAWSLAIYPKVERLLLKLQEEHNADVNLILFCAWAGRLSGDELAAAEAAVASWRDHVVVPLRRARQAARGTPLHEALKSVELAAERHAQERIVAAVPKPRGEKSALTLYLNRINAPPSEQREIIEAFQQG